MAKPSTIQSLIYSANFLADSISVREVKTWFNTQPTISSLGVVGEQGAIGLINRNYFQQILLEYAGDASVFEKSVSQIIQNDPFIVSGEERSQDVLERLFSEKGQKDTFWDDIIVCSEKEFIGLVAVRDLVIDQFTNLLHRMTAMEAQQATLTRQNKELFQNSFLQGQRETQYRSFFDHAPLPIAIFDLNGQFLAASARFYRLGNFSHRDLDSRSKFQTLFTADWQEVRKALDEAQQSDSDQFFYTLTLACKDKPSAKVDTLIEWATDWGHVVINIISPHTKEGEASINQLLVSTAAKTSGKITQAIKMKVSAKNADDLARSVAHNLIDRVDEQEILLPKLEKIIEYSNIVQQHESEPPQAEESDERQHFKGRLSEFSVIDLCQILIQGTKTGQLLLYRNNETEIVAYIYFYCGGMIHAKHRDGVDGTYEGADVLPLILKMKEGGFDFVFDKSCPKTTIKGDPMSLLMDACRRADEEI